MNTPKEVLKIFEKYTPQVDAEIKKLLASQEKLDMYKMMSYFFGYTDENFRKIAGYGGKHFRSGICLLLSEFYGVSSKALEAATALEIFHNFTLIHDDIEDCDPIRRGRPTVWKIWGINHGINSGDAQLILANHELLKSQKYFKKGSQEFIEFVNGKFLEVAEGQFLDFTLSDSSIKDSYVSEAQYLKMITKKSGVLVATAAKMAGMIAGKSTKECEALWDYGLNLGLAYQLNDDLVSIWGNIEDTGKVEEKDIEERKKTLPIIYAFSELTGSTKKLFADIYDQKDNLTHDEISQIKNLLSEKAAHEYVWKRIQTYLKKSSTAIEKLSLTKKQKVLLSNINRALIPDTKMWDA